MQHSRFLNVLFLIQTSFGLSNCIYPYAPNAVLIGFISSFVGGLVSMDYDFTDCVVLSGCCLHFCGATAGVIGNASGGVRAKLEPSPRCAY